MKRLLDIPGYANDVRRVANLALPWEMLNGKSILITGGTGLIGSFLIDVLHAANLNCKVLLFGRDELKAKHRFKEYWKEDFLRFYAWNISDATLPEVNENVNYILHLASNTHPVAYASDPIGTIAANVIALNNLLSLATQKHINRFLFASSNEIYGENRGDVELFDEKYCGYIDCNTLRAGYPESKRCGEALCQAYIRQKDIDCVIARLTRTYGPTLLATDTKAISQFFKNALSNEDIVLKSSGTQYFSYMHVADSVSGLLTILLKGQSSEAYNIASENNDITLRDLATLIATSTGRNVVFDLPNETEKIGFSKATKARLDGTKLRALGWTPYFDSSAGVSDSIKIMKQMQ